MSNIFINSSYLSWILLFSSVASRSQRGKRSRMNQEHVPDIDLIPKQLPELAKLLHLHHLLHGQAQELCAIPMTLFSIFLLASFNTLLLPPVGDETKEVGVPRDNRFLEIIGKGELMPDAEDDA
jgi:hypothetical protein